MRILTRSTALLATCALLLLGGCSSDDGGGVDIDAADSTASQGDETTTTDGAGEGGDAQAFCDFMAEQEDLDINEDPEEVAAAMEEMRRLAPDEIRDDVEELLRVMEKFADIDEDDPEAFGEIMALVMDPRFVAVGERLDEFGVEECGLEEGELMGDDGDGEFTPITSGEGDDDGNVDLDEHEGGMSIDVLQEHIDEGYGDEEWADKLSSWSILGATEVQVGSLGRELTVPEAMAACEALAEKVFELEPEATLEIVDTENEAVARRGPDDDSCVAVL